MGSWLLENATIIDGTGAVLPRGHAVLTDGDRIAGVGEAAGLAAPDGVRRVDLAGKWVLPGLVNAHDHVCMKDALVDESTRGAYYDIYRQPASTQLLRGARGALVSLSQGITAARDAGTMDQLCLDLRDAIDDELVVGPRLYTCGSPLSVPFEGEGVAPAGMTVDAGGVDAVRATVRGLLERGVDFVKMKGHRRDFGSPRTNLYSREELAAAVKEAHAAGVPITFHAWHVEIIEAAVELGADAVEHGNPLCQKPELAARMAEQDVSYVPNIMQWAPDPEQHTAAMNEKAAISKEEIWPSARSAIEAGVRIGVGTDLHTAMMSHEMQALRSLGMSAMDVLVAATRSGAEILRRQDEFGTIEAGKKADLVVLDADPLEDLQALDRPHLVFKDGRRYDPEGLRQAIGSLPLKLAS